MSLFGLFEALVPEPIEIDDQTTLAALVAPAVEHQRGILVFVHGFTGSKEDFVLVMPDLAELGWTTVAYDARGTYESTGAAPFDRAQLARDLVHVVGWARERFGDEDTDLHIVGHSYGGLVAQEAVALSPAAATSLVLLCSGPAGVAVIGADEQEITIGRAHQFRDILSGNTIDEAWDVKAGVEGLDMSNPFAKFLRERFVTTDKDSLLACVEDLLNTPDLVDGVRATGIRVRWAHGAGDGSWSQATQAASAARYGTHCHIIPDAMHSPCIENDEATTAWLDAVLGRTH